MDDLFHVNKSEVLYDTNSATLNQPWIRGKGQWGVIWLYWIRGIYSVLLASDNLFYRYRVWKVFLPCPVYA